MKRIVLATLAVLVVVGAVAVRELGRSTTYQVCGEIVPRVATKQPVVALTFDDGPAPDVRELLDVLAAKHVRATFFLIGAQMAEDPEDARRIVAAGHQVGNHSWSHDRMWFKSPRFVAREIESTDRQIRQAGYRGPIVFRAPFGKKLIALPCYLARHHRVNVMWDVAPDSDSVDHPTDRIVADVLAHARPGSIILLHPMYRNRAATRAAVAPIIDGLRARGLNFVTVDQLLALRT